jgi:hypothetical protein
LAILLSIWSKSQLNAKANEKREPARRPWMASLRELRACSKTTPAFIAVIARSEGDEAIHS